MPRSGYLAMRRTIRDVAKKPTARIYCPRCTRKGTRHHCGNKKRCYWLRCQHCSIPGFDYIWDAFNGRIAPPPDSMRKNAPPTS